MSVSVSPHQPRRGRGRVGTRIALCACVLLAAALSVQACGGSSVSEPIPKSTPNIVPPADTSAEKAAISTTSTSTTSTSKTTTTGEPSASGGEESSGEKGSEAGTGEKGSESGASGGAPAETEKPAAKEEGTGGATGGASAP